MSGSKDNTRAEDFKRATAGALRAIAQVPDVQVAFQPGPAVVQGKRARLPLPTRALPAAEMAKLRGAADSAALRLRHHDAEIHAARSPGPRDARDVYDALEQARVEVVGAQHMAGVSANLAAKLQDWAEAEGFDRMVRKDQLPLPAALSLLAREAMGERAPAAAERILSTWRDTLAAGAADAMAEMAAARDDQVGFTRAARKLLAALDLAEAEVESDPEQGEEEGESGEQGGAQDNQESGDGQQQAEAESPFGSQPEHAEGESAPDESEDTEDDAAQVEGEDRPGGPQPRREKPIGD
ncbi:MAG: cobaltochelatase subunit CobT, partial [Acetobacteraceae bacterium]|nr:cobaltochelatase subunit CobT [Acetobacteraceae bacterium]